MRKSLLLIFIGSLLFLLVYCQSEKDVPRIGIFKKGIYLGITKKELTSSGAVRLDHLVNSKYAVRNPKEIDANARSIYLFIDRNDRLYEIVVNYGPWPSFDDGDLGDVIEGVYGTPNTTSSSKREWQDGRYLLEFERSYSIGQRLTFTHLGLSQDQDRYRTAEIEREQNAKTGRAIKKWDR